MTEYLWTGESAFCKCTHHLEDHYYTNCNTAECFKEIGGYSNMEPHCHGTNNKPEFCKCTGFVPYKTEPETHVETEPLEVITAH